MKKDIYPLENKYKTIEMKVIVQKKLVKISDSCILHSDQGVV
ncbi:MULTISPECIES: hypothetical protein [Staphylococcus]|nr:hypothetical protein [Staphylococcus haemolyticus]MDU0440562.1 hypothetical protein [Staphylococcus haemolyticus]